MIFLNDITEYMIYTEKHWLQCECFNVVTLVTFNAFIDIWRKQVLRYSDAKVCKVVCRWRCIFDDLETERNDALNSQKIHHALSLHFRALKAEFGFIPLLFSQILASMTGAVYSSQKCLSFSCRIEIQGIEISNSSTSLSSYALVFFSFQLFILQGTVVTRAGLRFSLDPSPSLLPISFGEVCKQSLPSAHSSTFPSYRQNSPSSHCHLVICPSPNKPLR